MTNTANHFRLFANCIPVKGAYRSVICDLQRRRLDFIPNELYKILHQDKERSIAEIFATYHPSNHATIQSYFDFLVKKDYIFYCEKFELDLFPELNLNSEAPNWIEHAIIDFDRNSKHELPIIFDQLEALGCVAIQLRFFDEVSLETIYSILGNLQGTSIEVVVILLKYTNELNSANLQYLGDHFPRVSDLVIHACPQAKNFEFQHEFLTIQWTEIGISSHRYCGQISPKHFVVNQDTFLESQQFNTCLNRKIAIDVQGNIKNCPSLAKSYGQVKEIKLKEVISQANFKSLWTINKDKISICKDCEFRHICTDCRAYLEDPDDIYSKPLKCGYNPYTGEWKEWSKNPLKEKTIDFYQINSAFL